MSTNFFALDVTRAYRHVYLLESRQWWPQLQEQFDPAQDLVLTYDFGLRNEIQRRGGVALYVDHLVDPARMERNNFLTYEFFRRWHLDATGDDIFTYRQIPFGFSFRIEIWNDLIFGVRIRASLARLRELHFKTLIVGTHGNLIESALVELGVPFTPIAPGSGPPVAAYFFPIARWMDEKVRSRKLKHQLKPLAARITGLSRLWLRRLTAGRKRKPAVFIQEYYPTRRILQYLQRDPRLQVVLAQYSWAPGLRKLLIEHAVPVWGNTRKFQEEANRLMEHFRRARYAKLVLEDGLDVTAGIFAVLEKRVAAQLPETLRTLSCVLHFFDRNPVQLEVMVANIGRMNALVHAVCQARGVPSYLIINGMLVHAYLDESKYADRINAYSVSIRDHYFRGMSNVFSLGDPRMDDYANAAQRPRTRPGPVAVTIGTAGHNITNLSSYVAVEFEFLHDILLALQIVQERGTRAHIVIKVRDNGYRDQYAAFVAEYFPGLVAEIVQGTPMRPILDRTDFYISIGSQTLIEAACLGIPSVYYKKDTEVMYPPFDAASELVTVSTVEQMVQAFEDFLSGQARFAAFMQRQTLEKYIGPLDGRNLQRNLDQIYGLLGLDPAGEVH
ncbi:MAG TPA: hypothetical protein VI653_17540 [Steroidobacteraceae bacterium]